MCLINHIQPSAIRGGLGKQKREEGEEEGEEVRRRRGEEEGGERRRRGKKAEKRIIEEALWAESFATDDARTEHCTVNSVSGSGQVKTAGIV